MTLINQEKEVDIKFCVLDLPELKRRILEEWHGSWIFIKKYNLNFTTSILLVKQIL
jgi:hypothetical protein